MARGIDPSTVNYRSFVHIGGGKLVDLQKMPHERDGDKAKIMTRVMAPIIQMIHPELEITVNPECYDVDLEKYLADEETTREVWVGTKWGNERNDIRNSRLCPKKE